MLATSAEQVRLRGGDTASALVESKENRGTARFTRPLSCRAARDDLPGCYADR